LPTEGTGWARNARRFSKWNNILRRSGTILLTPMCYMSMSVINYCLDMTLWRWPRCCSVQSCSRGAKDVITRCRISLGIPWIRSRIGCFMSPNWEDVFRIPRLWRSAGGDSQVLQNYASGRHEKWVCWETLIENLNGYLFCVSSCSERHFTARGDGQYESASLAVKQVCKFQKPWDVSGSHIPPAPLILQNQTTV
jgi:hypothetical protein